MKRFKDFKNSLKEEVEVVVPAFTMEDVNAVKNALGLEFLCLKEILKIKRKVRKPNVVCPKELLKGLNVELEHIDVTNGDLVLTSKIALSHLREMPDYYVRLAKMEKGKK